MDYTTNVGWGLAQHRAHDLHDEMEQRRLRAQRTTSHPRTGANEVRIRRFDRATVTTPRFVLPVIAIGVMGALLGLVAVPSAVEADPMAPAMVVIDPGGSGGALPGGAFLAR